MPRFNSDTALKSCLNQDILEAGCDEAGRGCIAGPVFAAAVILPPDFKHSVLNDSKILSAESREKLRDEIIKVAVSWSVKYVDSDTIDKLNILRASILAMHKAIEGLDVNPEYLIIDGNRFFRYKSIEHRCIVKGDSKYFSIAAASVLAKTYRDDYMKKIHTEYKHYGWEKNKGYATRQHREAISNYGLTPYHRKSFRILNSQLNIKF
jgi:ribonuclease HII